MTGIAEHFALLEAGTPPGDATQLLTRPIGLNVDRGAILVGLDHIGRKHLLAPVGDAAVTPDRASRGVVLDERLLTTGDGATRFADLVCLAPRLSGPFVQLLEDIVGRFHVSGLRPAATILQALDDWRALLRSALGGLSRDMVLGLVGELEVLSRLAGADPHAAVDAWQVPTGATHDFSRKGHAIEVKSTSAVTPLSVRISNLDQLDASPARGLHLVVVHLIESVEAPDLEGRVEDLIERGVPAGRLLTTLEIAGYVRGMEIDVPTRYSVRSTRVWHVGTDFPALRQSGVDSRALRCVANVEYDLLLGGLPTPLSEPEADVLFASWGGSD